MLTFCWVNVNTKGMGPIKEYPGKTALEGRNMGRRKKYEAGLHLTNRKYLCLWLISLVAWWNCINIDMQSWNHLFKMGKKNHHARVFELVPWPNVSVALHHSLRQHLQNSHAFFKTLNDVKKIKFENYEGCVVKRGMCGGGVWWKGMWECGEREDVWWGCVVDIPPDPEADTPPGPRDTPPTQRQDGHWSGRYASYFVHSCHCYFWATSATYTILTSLSSFFLIQASINRRLLS